MGQTETENEQMSVSAWFILSSIYSVLGLLLAVSGQSASISAARLSRDKFEDRGSSGQDSAATSRSFHGDAVGHIGMSETTRLRCGSVANVRKLVWPRRRCPDVSFQPRTAAT